MCRRAPIFTALRSTLVVLLLGTALTGCGSDADSGDENPSPSTTHTLVFVDHSVSTGDHPDARSLFADSLARIVDQNMDTPDDRISLFFVHEKTLSKAHQVDLTNDVPPPNETQFADEQALAEARHKRQTEQFLQQTTQRLQTALKSPPIKSAFTDWTDLWGTLGVASTTLAPAADQHRVYYFSDMFESMPGADRRNFDRRPPQSRTQAERWAQADADALDTLMVLRPARLQNAEVRVLLGTLATKAHAQHVKFYWLALFQELDLSRTQVDYN
jgi:hypothetical protein